MKRFITQTLIFAIVAILCVVLFWSLIISKRDQIVHTDGIETLIMGNSEVCCGINDSIWPHALNVGMLAEHVEHSYAKLKMIHKANPSLKRVIMGFDNNILFKSINGIDDNHAHLMHPFYFDYYNTDNIIKTIEYSDYAWWQGYISQPFSPKKNFPPLKSLFSGNIGIQDLDIGYTNWFPEHMTQQEEKKAHIANDMKISTFKDNRLTIYYFQQMVDYCKKNNLELVFLTMPNYYRCVPDTSYLVIKKEHFREVPHLDYFQYPFSAEYFHDRLHLRCNGRDSITRVVMRDIDAPKGDRSTHCSFKNCSF